MNTYDYENAVLEDCKDEIMEMYKYDSKQFTNRDDVETMLNDELFISDNVTGNGSGSYTFSSFQAQENLYCNEELLKQALAEFCVPSDEITEHFLNGDYEYFDVTIRCYLLSQCIAQALDELESDNLIQYNE